MSALLTGALLSGCGSTLEQAERALQREDFARADRLATTLQSDGDDEAAALIRIDGALAVGDVAQAREVLGPRLAAAPSTEILQRSWRVSIAENDAGAAAAAFEALRQRELTPNRDAPPDLLTGVASALVSADPAALARFFEFAPSANNEDTRAALQPRIDLALYAMLRTGQPHNSLRLIEAWESLIGPNNVLAKHRVAAMLESRAGRDGPGALERFVGADNDLLAAVAVEFRLRGADRAAEHAFVLLAARDPNREVGALLDAAAAAYRGSGAEVAREHLTAAWLASGRDVRVAQSALVLADAQDTDDFVYAFTEDALQHGGCADAADVVLDLEARLAALDLADLAFPAATLRFERLLDDGCPASDVARSATLLFAAAGDVRRAETFFQIAFEAGARDAALLTATLDLADRQSRPDFAAAALDAYIASATFADWTDATLRDLQRRLSASPDPEQVSKGRALLRAGFEARPDSGYLANALAEGATPEERDAVFARYVDASEDALSARTRVAQWRVSGGDTSDGVLEYLSALRDTPGADNHDAPFVYRGSTSTRETAELLIVDVWLERGDRERALERGLAFATGSAQRFEVLWSHRELRSGLSPEQQLRLTSSALAAGWSDATVHIARGMALLDMQRSDEATEAFLLGVAQDPARRTDIIDALFNARLLRAAWEVARGSRSERSVYDSESARVLHRVIQARATGPDTERVGVLGQSERAIRSIAAMNELERMAEAAGVQTLPLAEVEQLTRSLSFAPPSAASADFQRALFERLLEATTRPLDRAVLTQRLARVGGWDATNRARLLAALRDADDDELATVRLRPEVTEDPRFAELIARERLRRRFDTARAYVTAVGDLLGDVTVAAERPASQEAAQIVAEITREFALRDALLLLRDVAPESPWLAGRVDDETTCALGMVAYRGMWTSGNGEELAALVPLMLSRCPSFRLSDAIAVVGLRYPEGIPASEALALAADAGGRTWAAISEAFLLRGHWEAARATTQRWLLEAPDDIDALYATVLTALALGDIGPAEAAALALAEGAANTNHANVDNREFFARMAAGWFDSVGRTLTAHQLLQRIARAPNASEQARVEYVELSLRLGDRGPLDEMLSRQPRRPTPALATFAGALLRNGVTDELLRWAETNMSSLSSADASAMWTETPFVAPLYGDEHQDTVAALFQRSLRIAADSGEARLFEAEQLGLLGLSAQSDAAARSLAADGNVTLHALLLDGGASGPAQSVAYLNAGADPRAPASALRRLTFESLLMRTPAELDVWLDRLLSESASQLGSTSDEVRDLQVRLRLATASASDDAVLRATPDQLARSGRFAEARSLADPIFDAPALVRAGGLAGDLQSVGACLTLPDLPRLRACVDAVRSPVRAEPVDDDLAAVWLAGAAARIDGVDATSSGVVAHQVAFNITPWAETEQLQFAYLWLEDEAFARLLERHIAMNANPSYALDAMADVVNPEASPQTQRVLDTLTQARTPLDIPARVDRWWSASAPLHELVTSVGCDPGGVEQMLLYSQERQRLQFFESLATAASNCTTLTWRSHTERALVRASQADSRWLLSAREALRLAPEPGTVAQYLLDRLPVTATLADGLLEFAAERQSAGDDVLRVLALQAAALAADGQPQAALNTLQRLSLAGGLPPDGWLRAIDALCRAGYTEEARQAVVYLERYRGDAASYASGLAGFSRVGLALRALASSPETALSYLSDEAAGVLAVPSVALQDSLIPELFDSAGQHETAWSVFEAILAADETNDIARNNYAYSLANAREHLAQAEYHARAALAADAGAPSAYKLDTLAWVLHQMGRHEEALVWMRMALRAAGPTQTSENLAAGVYFEHLREIEAAVASSQANEEPEPRRRRQRRR